MTLGPKPRLVLARHRANGALTAASADTERTALLRMLTTTRQMAQIRDLQPLVRFVLEEAQALMRASAASLFLLRGTGLTSAEMAWEANGTPSGARVNSLLRNTCADTIQRRTLGWVAADQTLVVPLVSGAELRGALALGSPAARDSSAQTELLVIFAEHAAVCLENALLHRRSMDQLSYMSHYDDMLTKLPNRVLFRKQLAEALRTAGTAAQLAVLFIDLDDFQSINRQSGHCTGDAVLYAVAQRMTASSKACGLEHLPARMGGDEFALVHTRPRTRQVAEETAARLLMDLQAPLLADGMQHRITASAGIALYPDAARTPEELLGRAEQALYRAKALGGNRWCSA